MKGMEARNPTDLRSIAASESGIAMLMAMVLILIVSLLTAALANLAVAEYASAVTVDHATQAFLSAEAGGEQAVAALVAQADWALPVAGVLVGSNWTPSSFNSDPFPTWGQAGRDNYQVWMRHPSGADPSSNMMVRAMGRFRNSTRSIEFSVHRRTGADFATYSIDTLDFTSCNGCGSMQFHGSAYFEASLLLRGGNQSGFYNDRYVFSSDAPRYLNHLFIRGVLDNSTGNPTIGNPYWWVHLENPPIGSSMNFNVVNLDYGRVPPPFYPTLITPAGATQPEGAINGALTSILSGGSGNALDTASGTMRLVRCTWNGSIWRQDTLTSNLLLAAGQVFYLPRAGATSCDNSTDPVANVQSSGNYALLWDPNATTPNANLIFGNDPSLQIYIPGMVLVSQNIRYEGKGSIFVANQATATTPDALLPQNGCALDFNYDPANPACSAPASRGRTITARVPPCIGQPGNDDSRTTYPRGDLAVFFVNGAAYSNLTANSCDQQMNLVAVIGDRYSQAVTNIRNKLQWYGVLMTRTLGTSQVPDFWQMPDMINALPGPARQVLLQASTSVEIRDWRELMR